MWKWAITIGALFAVALVLRAGAGDTARKVVFYGGAVGIAGLKIAGLVIPLGWAFVPILAGIGILTEPEATASGTVQGVSV